MLSSTIVHAILCSSNKNEKETIIFHAVLNNSLIFAFYMDHISIQAQLLQEAMTVKHLLQITDRCKQISEYGRIS